MTTYNITLTEQERAVVLHCIGRVESIVAINYEETPDKTKQRKYKRDSEVLVALWHKIKNTEPQSKK